MINIKFMIIPFSQICIFISLCLSLYEECSFPLPVVKNTYPLTYVISIDWFSRSVNQTEKNRINRWLSAIEFVIFIIN